MRCGACWSVLGIRSCVCGVSPLRGLRPKGFSQVIGAYCTTRRSRSWSLGGTLAPLSCPPIHAKNHVGLRRFHRRERGRHNKDGVPQNRPNHARKADRKALDRSEEYAAVGEKNETPKSHLCRWRSTELHEGRACSSGAARSRPRRSLGSYRSTL